MLGWQAKRCKKRKRYVRVYFRTNSEAPMSIVDKVKLVVVHRDSPDIEIQLGTFPSKDAAMPAYKEAVAKHDTLRAAIEPVDADATPENSASYQSSPEAKETR
jgi:hypothetical protein